MGQKRRQAEESVDWDFSNIDHFHLQGVRHLIRTMTQVVVAARALSYITLLLPLIEDPTLRAPYLVLPFLVVDLIIAVRTPVDLEVHRRLLSWWLLISAVAITLTHSPTSNAVYAAMATIALVVFLSGLRGLIVGVSLVVISDAIAMTLHPVATAELRTWYSNLYIEGPWFFIIRWASTVVIGFAGLHLARLASGWARAATMERERLRQDLHDTVAKTVVGVGLLADSLPGAIDDVEEMARLSREIRRAVQLSISESRRIVDGIGVAPIEELGRAVRQHVRRTARHWSVPIDLVIRLDDPVLRACGNEVFAILIEALNNARRHSAASAVSVELVAEDGAITLTVSDDGVGANLANLDDSAFGLDSIRIRAKRFQGSLNIITETGEGFTLVVTLLNQHDDEHVTVGSGVFLR